MVKETSLFSSSFSSSDIFLRDVETKNKAKRTVNLHWPWSLDTGSTILSLLSTLLNVYGPKSAFFKNNSEEILRPEEAETGRTMIPGEFTEIRKQRKMDTLHERILVCH